MTILLLALAVIAAGGFILTQVGIAVTIGFVAMVLAGVVGAGLGIWGMYNAILDYLDDESDRGELVINLLKRGAVLILSGIVLFNSVPQVWTAFSDWRISQQQEQLPPDDGADSGSLDHLKIDMDDRDLENWLAEFNSNWRVEMLNTWDDSSMPSNAEARNKAVHDAGGKFEYAVSTPMQDLKILLDGSYTDGTLAQIKKGIQKKIIMDPIYADGFVQACRLMAPEILTLNPWLQEYADWLDEVFGRTDSTTKGINALLNDDCTALRTDVFYNNVRLAVLFSQFTAVGVEAAESSHNWHLPIVAKASDTRLVESPVQESSAAVIFVARYKLADGTEGECAIKIGINVWDKRIELFNPKAPVQPPKEDKPTGNGDPIEKPNEKTYVIYAIGYEWGTNKTVTVLPKATVVSGVKSGESRTISAPNVSGYVVHAGYESVSVTVNGSNAVAEFYYDKIPAQAKTYKVTAIGYEWGNRNNIVLSEYTIYDAVPNGTYNVNAKPVNGYTIHKGYETVKVTVNGSNIRAEFYYDKVADYRLYYQRGYYSLNGKWTLLDANPVYVGTYAAGADYSFNVSAPSGNQDTNYVLRDSARITGEMPAQDYTIPVVCLVQHKLDISYKKVTDTGSVKAFDPHREWVTEGASYYVVAPYLKGYYADPDPVAGTMGTDPVYLTVFYYKNGQKPDGGGAKLPQTDPVNTERDDGSGKSNAEVGGGENLSGDGNGGHQTSDPGASDYPAQGSNDTNKPGGSSGNNDTSNTTTGNNGGANTVTGGDHQTSGETGKPAGGNETVKADDGGTTHGGTTDSDPITPVDNTTVTTTTDNGNGTSTTTTENTGGQTFDGQYSGGEPQ